jgi:hypothetical protein
MISLKAAVEGLYISDYTAQVAKTSNPVCGDLAYVTRNEDYTLALLCDGVGSGIKANIAAKILAKRIERLVANGFLSGKLSMRAIFERIALDLEKAKTLDIISCAVTAAFFLSDGRVSLFSYEMPTSFILKENSQNWRQIQFKTVPTEKNRPEFCEANFSLDWGDTLCLISDGIPAHKNPAEIIKNLDSIFKSDMPLSSAANMLLDHCMQDILKSEDDATAMVLHAKKPEVLHILTGVSAQKDNDAFAVNKFLELDGKKVICGSTTMDVFCRVTDLKAAINTSFYADFIPPEYFIEGIDLATEGAITLNQCHNILFDDFFKDKANTAPEKLAKLMETYDVINFIVGTAENKSHDTAEFKQIGILPRSEIIPQLIRKLKNNGKVVLTDYI